LSICVSTREGVPQLKLLSGQHRELRARMLLNETGKVPINQPRSSTLLKIRKVTVVFPVKYHMGRELSQYRSQVSK
jgi:hypothetical protein